MDFGLTDEKRCRRRRPVTSSPRLPPVARPRNGTKPGHPTELFRAMADIGWFGLPLPEKAVEAAGSAMELVLMAEELGRASLDIAMCYAGTFIPGVTLQRWGSAQQRERYLPGMIDGSRRFAIAMSEPTPVLSRRLAYRGRAGEADFIVNGRRCGAPGPGFPARPSRRTSHQPRGPQAPGTLVAADRPARRGSRSGAPLPSLATSSAPTRSSSATSSVPQDNLVGPLNGGWKVLLSSLDAEQI